jgi:hypothetical protein
MHRIWAGALAAALALTLAIAGCGGDDDDKPAGAATAKTGFVAEASRICERVTDRTTKALSVAARKSPNAGGRGPAFADLVARVADIRRQGIDDLEALTAPDGQSTAFNRFIEARRAGVDLLPTADEARKGKDPNAERREKRETEASRLAERLRISC